MSINGLNESKENSVNITEQRIPFLSNKHLKDLREKCNHWIDEFAEALANPGASTIAMSAFETACVKSKGKPFAFDDGNMRSLHFDKRTMQSAMWLETPDELAFGYTRCMMGFLLSNTAPQHILMIGLGGGSLLKYCYRYFPATRITVIEIDARVIALRDAFLIPPDDDRLTVIHMNAAKYVHQAKHEVDVILLDGFDADGLVSELISNDFYLACKDILTQDGILVSNMWGDSADLAAVISRKNAIFNNAVWWCRSIDSYNLITFAFKSAEHAFKHQLTEQAKLLDQHYRLELEKLVGRLQTIPAANFANNEHTSYTQGDLLGFMSLKELTEKIRDHLVVDELVSRTRLEWLETQQHEAGE